MLKHGNMPTVNVVEVLTSKVYNKSYKDANHEDGDRSRGEDEDNEEVLKDEENADIDPMDMLFECAPDLETPKKQSDRKREQQRLSGPQRSLVRAIDMPERPHCVGGAAGARKIVHVFVRPNSKALWINMDCSDWLISYAADEHHYQGISRVDAAASEPAADYDIEWEYNDKAFDCKTNVGMDAGLTLRMTLVALTKDVFDKLAEKDDAYAYWSKATSALKRKACREYLQLWCVATIDCSRQQFEAKWGCPISAKKRKTDINCQTAVAASQPATGAAASKDIEQPSTGVAVSAVAACVHTCNACPTAVAASAVAAASEKAPEDSQTAVAASAAAADIQ